MHSIVVSLCTSITILKFHLSMHQCINAKYVKFMSQDINSCQTNHTDGVIMLCRIKLLYATQYVKFYAALENILRKTWKSMSWWIKSRILHFLDEPWWKSIILLNLTLHLSSIISYFATYISFCYFQSVKRSLEHNVTQHHKMRAFWVKYQNFEL